MLYAYQSAGLQLIWCILYGEYRVLYCQHLHDILNPTWNILERIYNTSRGWPWGACPMLRKKQAHGEWLIKNLGKHQMILQNLQCHIVKKKTRKFDVASECIRASPMM
jgi:hypothetical protein